MMLNQISRKSQSDTMNYNTNRNNYHWLLGGNSTSEIPVKKTFYDTTNQTTHVADFSSDMHLIPGIYEYPNQIVAPLSIMSTESEINSVNINSDPDFPTLINAYSANSLDDSSLSDIFNKNCIESSQNVSSYQGVKNIKSIEKNETQNIPLLSTFDSSILQDDLGYLQDNFPGSWDETMEFSSFSAPSSSDNQGLTLCSSLDPMNPTLRNTS
ncbi:hypothetical protein PCK1_000876 [Pneumocystis canis]|nr:hypothetical protein PCK1_000876 [Pneumocystis canis]